MTLGPDTTVVEQSTHHPEFKGLKRAAAGTERNQKVASICSQVVDQLTHDPIVQGLNPAASGTGKEQKKVLVRWQAMLGSWQNKYLLILSQCV